MKNEPSIKSFKLHKEDLCEVEVVYNNKGQKLYTIDSLICSYPEIKRILKNQIKLANLNHSTPKKTYKKQKGVNFNSTDLGANSSVDTLQCMTIRKGGVL